MHGRTPAGRGELVTVLGVLLVFVLVLGIVAVGCGSEDEESTEASSTTAQATGEATDKVLIRVSGTQGIPYTGAYGLFEKAQRADGTLGAEPTEYELDVGDDGSPAVSAVFRKTQPADEGTLKVEIVADGEVVAEDETSADLGVVRATWSPQGRTIGEHLGER